MQVIRAALISAFIVALLCLSEQSSYVNAVKGEQQVPVEVQDPAGGGPPEGVLIPVETKYSRYKEDSIAGQLEKALEKEFPDDR